MWQPLARSDDLPPGAMLGVVKEDGTRICLINLNGEVHAVSDVCTHQGYSMSSGTLLPGGRIECGWHGTVYHCASGVVECGPATEPLPVYAVRVEDGVIQVGERLP